MQQLDAQYLNPLAESQKLVQKKVRLERACTSCANALSKLFLLVTFLMNP